MQPLALVILLFYCGLAPSAAFSQQLPGQDSPSWLAAVGRLAVPGQQWEDGDWTQQLEHCSATLLTPSNDSRVSYLISAWHCVEYYRDLSYDISFILPGAKQISKARLVASGGGMDADWALLKLIEPMLSTQIQGPVVAISASTNNGQVNRSDGALVTMAGYSSALPGAPLSYDEDCKILAREATRIATECRASKGASGGPVVSKNGQLLGVISAGDGDQLSYFAPISLFASVLRQYL